MERRKYDRIQLPVAVRPSKGETFSAQVIDLSPAGMRLAADRHVPKGEQVELDVYLKPSDPFPIRVLGTSVWSTQLKDNPIMIGLDLSLSNSRSLRVLESHIEKATRSED